MSLFSHLISVILAIGAYLGIPYAPLQTPTPISLPGLEQHLATTSFSNYAPLVPVAVVLPATNTSPEIPGLATTTKRQRLPTLALNAPTFTEIPLPSITVPAIPTPNNQTAPPPPAPSTSPPAFIPPAPIVPSTPPVSTPGSGNPESAAISAIVNVYCTSQSGNLLTIVTGSGVIIDPRGIILTNAHVADHLLLDDYLQDPNKKCVIRRGSPAVAEYIPTLLYISPAWLKLYGMNVDDVTQAEETGAGDYALLAIAGVTNGASIPTSFSYLPTDTSTASLSPNTSIFGVGYPASSLTAETVVKDLQIQTSPLSISDVYTFEGGDNKDLIKTNSTPLAEKGSSGGGILSQAGELIALIATTVPDNSNASLQDIQAITLNYINSDLQTSSGLNFASFLNQSIPTISANFKSTEASLFSYLPH